MKKLKIIKGLILGICLALLFSGCSANNDKKEEAQELELNKPFNIQTEYGDYSVTITGVKKTDWWSRFQKNDDKTVILLSYEVDNTSFKNDNYEGVVADGSLFSLIDEDGYNLPKSSFSYSEYPEYDVVAPGTKAKKEVPYILENDSSYVDISIKRGTPEKTLGTVRANIE